MVKFQALLQMIKARKTQSTKDNDEGIFEQSVMRRSDAKNTKYSTGKLTARTKCTITTYINW